MAVLIHQGDCREVLKTLPADSLDSCVTDPPYHLTSIVKRFGKPGSAPAKSDGATGVYGRAAAGFMGKQWDGGDVAFDPATWEAVGRVLKPGAHLVAFGGTRTFHRMAVAIEDAGFELRDTLMWVYGQGFPKSHNQDGEWEGWGTALKPAWEPIILARKPLAGTVAQNLAAHRTGAINIGGTLVGGEGGRWPANLLHDGSDDVVECFPNAPGAQGAVGPQYKPKQGTAVFGDYGPRPFVAPRGDSGSAARFFYCAKAARADRDDGLAGFDKKPLLWSAGTQNPGSFQSAGTDKSARNPHPTVKPTELMRWLCRLVTPPGGTVLDPFTGSGSTGRGAVLEGFDFVGVEREDEYVPIARARIAACVPADEALLA